MKKMICLSMLLHVLISCPMQEDPKEKERTALAPHRLHQEMLNASCLHLKLGMSDDPSDFPPEIPLSLGATALMNMVQNQAQGTILHAALASLTKRSLEQLTDLETHSLPEKRLLTGKLFTFLRGLTERIPAYTLSQHGRLLFHQLQNNPETLKEFQTLGWVMSDDGKTVHINIPRGTINLDITALMSDADQLLLRQDTDHSLERLFEICEHHYHADAPAEEIEYETRAEASCADVKPPSTSMIYRILRSIHKNTKETTLNETSQIGDLFTFWRNPKSPTTTGWGGTISRIPLVGRVVRLGTTAEQFKMLQDKPEEVQIVAHIGQIVTLLKTLETKKRNRRLEKVLLKMDAEQKLDEARSRRDCALIPELETTVEEMNDDEELTKTLEKIDKNPELLEALQNGDTERVARLMRAQNSAIDAKLASFEETWNKYGLTLLDTIRSSRTLLGEFLEMHDGNDIRTLVRFLTPDNLKRIETLQRTFSLQKSTIDKREEFKREFMEENGREPSMSEIPDFHIEDEEHYKTFFETAQKLHEHATNFVDCFDEKGHDVLQTLLEFSHPERLHELERFFMPKEASDTTRMVSKKTQQAINDARIAHSCIDAAKEAMRKEEGLRYAFFKELGRRGPSM